MDRKRDKPVVRVAVWLGRLLSLSGVFFALTVLVRYQGVGLSFFIVTCLFVASFSASIEFLYRGRFVIGGTMGGALGGAVFVLVSGKRDAYLGDLSIAIAAFGGMCLGCILSVILFLVITAYCHDSSISWSFLDDRVKAKGRLWAKVSASLLLVYILFAASLWATGTVKYERYPGIVQDSAPDKNEP